MPRVLYSAHMRSSRSDHTRANLEEASLVFESAHRVRYSRLLIVACLRARAYIDTAIKTHEKASRKFRIYDTRMATEAVSQPSRKGPNRIPKKTNRIMGFYADKHHRIPKNKTEIRAFTRTSTRRGGPGVDTRGHCWPKRQIIYSTAALCEEEATTTKAHLHIGNAESGAVRAPRSCCRYTRGGKERDVSIKVAARLKNSPRNTPPSTNLPMVRVMCPQ